MAFGGRLGDHMMDIGTGKGRSVAAAKIVSRGARPLLVVAVDSGATRLEVGVGEAETEAEATEEGLEGHLAIRDGGWRRGRRE